MAPASFQTFHIVSFPGVWYFSAGILFLVLGYAEIHYRFPFLPSRLFRKQPEIVFDMPFQVLLKEPVPVFLFIKDAHRYPVRLEEVSIRILGPEAAPPIVVRQTINKTVDAPFFSHTIHIPPIHFPQEGDYRIFARARIATGRERRQIILQDNYRGIPAHPFRLTVIPDPLPVFPGWHWGDLHFHSHYTADQVEFGAPVREAVIAAKALGLDFLAVTDHSYDLDDMPDNYLRNDPELTKWRAFWREMDEIQSQYSDFVLLPGEEVSVGNARGRNVHCLIIGDKRFHPGSGDSAERLLRSRPTLALPELLGRKDQKALAVAAHPLEKPPFSQRKILRRGTWTEADFRQPGLDALQIWNGPLNNAFREGLAHWVRLLAEGRRIGILAGNDAHGNFNCYRQISTPFLGMRYHREHLLGKTRTVVFSENLERASLINGIKRHRAVLSNGPIAVLELTGKNRCGIGEEFLPVNNSHVLIRAKSTRQYGPWQQIRLYWGTAGRRPEGEMAVPLASAKLSQTIRLPLPQGAAGYLRLEGETANDGTSYFCITNPVWITRR